MLGKLQIGYQIWRHFGTDWVRFRLLHALYQRTGAVKRRLPARAWTQQPLITFLTNSTLGDPETYLHYRRTQSPPFFFNPTDRLRYRTCFAQWDDETHSPLPIAEDIAQGVLRYFEHKTAQTGFPPNWHKNPFSGQAVLTDQHWTEISDFGAGDIKVIWEPSRFGFVYPLVRAYWRTGDERYPELFWQLLEDWRVHNPPQIGPNWKCGQETSLRVMAWCFGLYGFLQAQATTATRIAALTQMVAVSGERIAATLDYALSQRNNHGISEGMGLWTIGLLFPELQSADNWAKQGRLILEELGDTLIYNDGAFVQHSVNYHRLMLHDYLWSIRLGELHEQPLSAVLKRRVAKAGTWLYQIQDEVTGQVPHYGQTDGALILALSNCDYLDYRPVIQATHYLGTGERCYTSGPWDEDLLWLFGIDAQQAAINAPERVDLCAEQGGYYTLRSKRSFIFTRCATYHDRPSQADMLHVDLWWQGQNIALDAGTFSYNAPDPWNNPLASTAYHNTVSVDGADQMKRIGKFLWLPWLHSQVHTNQRSPLGQIAYWEGEHDGYTRRSSPVRHRRAIVRIGEETWLVLDKLSSQTLHTYRLHWLLPDVPHAWQPDTNQLHLNTAVGGYQIQLFCHADNNATTLVRADADNPRGWQAPYYSNRTPALSLDMTTSIAETWFCTLFSPISCQLIANNKQIELNTPQWQATLTHATPSDSSLLASVTLIGTRQDYLVLS